AGEAGPPVLELPGHEPLPCALFRLRARRRLVRRIHNWIPDFPDIPIFDQFPGWKYDPDWSRRHPDWKYPPDDPSRDPDRDRRPPRPGRKDPEPPKCGS